MISDQLRYKIENELPGEGGYWHSDTPEALIKMADILSSFNVPEESIYEVIQTCFYTGGKEYA